MPIYRFECTECRRVEEIRREMSEETPVNHKCQVLIPILHPDPDVEWIDENDVPRSVPGAQEFHCRGTMRRKYESFQFHISGR